MNKKNIQKAGSVIGSMNQDCTFINTSMDEIRKLMASSDVAGAMSLLSDQKNMIGSYHPYYPYYIIGMKTVLGKEVPYSKPLSREAIEMFHPSIKAKFKVSSKYSGFRNLKELLDYSYKTQTDIEINMIELKKMLGHVEDPYQQEITSIGNFSEGSWTIKPREFPEAKPYRITLEGVDESFNYILLRTTKIIGDNEIFMSNSEQNNTLYIELILNLKLKELSLNFRIKDTGTKDKNATLKYLKYIEQSGKGKKINVISLEDETVLVSGILNYINYNSGFDSIYEEILFLENILIIEKKYNKVIHIPSNIYQDDFEAINYLATGIRNGVVKGSWSSYSSELQLSENVDLWRDINDKPQVFVLKIKMDVIIFQEKFVVPKFTRKLSSSTYEDIDKLKKKLEVAEVGDTIKFKLIPKNDDSYEDIFEF